MEKRVIDLCEAATKWAEAAVTTMDQEALCIDALDQLKKSHINSQLLVSTQLEMHLLPLTKHPRKNIQDFPSNLIVSWREKFLEKIRSDEKNGSYRIHGDAETTNIETAEVKNVDKKRTLEKISDVEVVKVQNVDQNSVEAQSSMISHRSIMKCNNTCREIIRERIFDALLKVSGGVSDEKKFRSECM